MPDHVHLIFTPLYDGDSLHSVAEIMQGIKGSSAHRINRLLNRSGQVWQRESFDRVLRREESIRAKVEYMVQNPVRAGFGAKRYGVPLVVGSKSAKTAGASAKTVSPRHRRTSEDARAYITPAAANPDSPFRRRSDRRSCSAQDSVSAAAPGPLRALL